MNGGGTETRILMLTIAATLNLIWTAGDLGLKLTELDPSILGLEDPNLLKLRLKPHERKFFLQEVKNAKNMVL
jgi:hypothetical protein